MTGPPHNDGPRPYVGSHQIIDHHPSSLSQSIPDAKDAAQADLFDYARQLAEGVRDSGLQAAERNDVEWCERVLDWITDLDPGTELTADDVRSKFGASMGVGSVFRRASRARTIECIGLTESKAITRHRGLQRRWVRT